MEGGAVVDEGGAVDAGEVAAGSGVEHPSATVTRAAADSIGWSLTSAVREEVLNQLRLHGEPMFGSGMPCYEALPSI